MIKLFKKSSKPVVLTIQELRPFFFKEIQKELKENYVIFEKLKENVKKSLHDLKQKLLVLQSTENDNKKAIHLKHRFVKIALESLNSLEEIKDYYEFYERIENALIKIESISPREFLHLRFYYEDEVREIVRSIKILRKNLKIFKKGIYSGVLKEKDYVIKLIDKIEEIRKSINEKNERISYINSEINKLKNENKKIKEQLEIMKIDVINYEDLLNEKKNIQSHIFYIFDSISKLIKKFVHEVNGKENVYNLFINNENEAKRFIINAIAYARKGLIHVDDKIIEKAESIIANWNFLLNKKKLLNEIEKKIEEKKKEEESIKPIIVKRNELLKQVDTINNNMQLLEEEKAKLNIEIKRLLSNLEEEKVKIMNTLKDVLNVEVVIK